MRCNGGPSPRARRAGCAREEVVAWVRRVRRFPLRSSRGAVEAAESLDCSQCDATAWYMNFAPAPPARRGGVFVGARRLVFSPGSRLEEAIPLVQHLVVGGVHAVGFLQGERHEPRDVGERLDVAGGHLVVQIESAILLVQVWDRRTVDHCLTERVGEVHLPFNGDAMVDHGVGFFDVGRVLRDGVGVHERDGAALGIGERNLRALLRRPQHHRLPADVGAT